jgi:uncharacterized membrane protein (DUF106 family)
MATIFILFLSIVISLVTSLANRRIMNLEEYRKMMIESNRVRSEVMEAMRSGNQRRISKAQNRQKELMQAQSKMSMDRMKIMLFFMVPFLIIWQFLGNFFGKNIIAYMPFKAPFLGSELAIGYWYIICSITTNIIISRALGLTFEIDPEES